MKSTATSAKRQLLTACGCGGVAMAMAMGFGGGQVHANEAVVPLVIPLVVPESAEHDGAASDDADYGFAGGAAGGNVAPVSPGFGIPDDHAMDDPQGRAPQSFRSFDDSLEAMDAPMPDDPDLEWMVEDGHSPSPSETGDMPGAFDNGPPSLVDAWLSGYDMDGGLFASGGNLDRLTRGIGLGLSLTGIYESNPSRGYTGEANDGSGDFSLMLGGGLSYRSRAST